MLTQPADRARESARPQSVSVVICTYSDARFDDAIQAIESVDRQTIAPLETIVVVDHNERLLRRLVDLGLRADVVGNTYEPGLSGARNTGLDMARGDVVAFLDDDAVADPEWLEGLLSHYRESTAGVGGAVIARWQGERPAWFPEEFEWVVGCSYRGLPTTPAEIRNPIGANMSFRRDQLGRAGGFSTMLGRIDARPVGCEETEACIRIARLWPDERFLYVPVARVVHKVHSERTRFSYFVARCYGEGLSKAILTRQHGRAAGLASERTYLRRTLLLAFLRELRGLVGGDLDAGRRSGALVVGVAAAAAGYARGRIRRASRSLRGGSGSRRLGDSRGAP